MQFGNLCTKSVLSKKSPKLSTASIGTSPCNTLSLPFCLKEFSSFSKALFIAVFFSLDILRLANPVSSFLSTLYKALAFGVSYSLELTFHLLLN